MSITKIEEWAADVVDESDINGPKVEPDSTYLDRVPSGMTAERLPYPTFNRILNDIHVKINEHISKGPKGANPSSTMESVLKGIRSSSEFGTFGYDSHNELYSGDASDEYYDLALAVIDGVRKVICLDWTTALNVEIFDVDNMAYEGSQAIPSSSLPSDGNENWVPLAIVCDLNYAYIVFGSNSSGSTYDYDHYIQAYRLSDWTVKSGWPATGLFLFDHATIQTPHLIFANDDLLAVDDDELTITGGTSRAVILIDAATGVEDSYGAGDLSSGTVASLCSNGEYIFIATTSYVGSMSIASPSSGCGGTGWPRNVGAEWVTCLGDVVVSNAGTAAHVLSVDNANIGTITPADNSVIKYMGYLTTDGLNFWVRGSKTIGATDRTCFLFKMNLHKLMRENSTTPEAAAEEIFEAFALSQDNGTRQSRMVYDGDGIVCIHNFNGSGKLHKLSKTILR